jgi:hypothetical protein
MTIWLEGSYLNCLDSHRGGFVLDSLEEAEKTLEIGLQAHNHTGHGELIGGRVHRSRRKSLDAKRSTFNERTDPRHQVHLRRLGVGSAQQHFW